ncbi:MAG: ABC transporter substrate-binding protein [Actinomycetota bacterium]
MGAESGWTNPIDRRTFLRRAAAMGVAIPSLSVILAACGSDDPAGDVGGGDNGGSGGIQLARPDNPVTLPITDDNPAIADGLDPEAGPLRVFGYNDYIYKKVRRAFGEQYGVEIEYTVFDTPDEMVSKMQAGGANYDLIVSVTLENVGKLAYGGLIQPLNHSYLPNFSNVWTGLQDPYYDKGSGYTVPYTVYTTGIITQNDKVTGDVGAMDNPYDILWDTAWAGQTHLLNGSRDLLATALMRMGEDVNTEDGAVLDQAQQMLLEGVDSMQWKFDHVDYNELGDFAIHESWSGQVVYYQYYLPDGLGIDKFSYFWPPATSAQDGILTNDMFAIPKGARSPVLAHLMIDFLLDGDNALTNYGYEGYQPPLVSFDNEQVLADGLVPENLANILLTEADLERGVQQLELPAETTQRYQEIYQQVTGGA